MIDQAPIAVVLTAIPVEHAAMRAHLLDSEEYVHPAGTIFRIGRLRNGPWRVVLTQTGQGNQRAAAITERAISHFHPDLVMLVGVAGRLHTDLSLGDIVVAKKVYAIHGGREDDVEFRPRPEVLLPDNGHVQRAERIAESGSWLGALPDESSSGVKAVVRAIASGEVVLDSVKSPYAQKIQRYYDDAAAIDMEGAGVALASQLNESLPVVVLRGISDFANGQKEVADRAGWQQRSAANAAAFAVTMLAELVPTRRVWTPEPPGAVEQDLLFGDTEQQIAAVHRLTRHPNAIPLLVKGFNAIRDSEVTSRIVWALSGLGTAAARDALQGLTPRYEFERLVIRDAIEACLRQSKR